MFFGHSYIVTGTYSLVVRTLMPEGYITAPGQVVGGMCVSSIVDKCSNQGGLDY